MMLWLLLALLLAQIAAVVVVLRRLARVARAVDLVDERVMEQLGGLGSTLQDVHERAKHPHPLHGPVK